jgi:1-deoxy-D-xylulose-5-phosphate reductoisomerase
MRTPIQYALTYPERAGGISRRLDLSKAMTLNFEPPDMVRFPALKLAYEVARMGGTAGAVLNAANEEARAAFVAGEISFGEIFRLVGLTIAAHRLQANPSLDDLLGADHWARNYVRSAVSPSRSA